jgi:hypothetical protein
MIDENNFIGKKWILQLYFFPEVYLSWGIE